MPHRNKYSVHISDMQAYKSCRRAWNWSSSLRGNLEPIEKYAPFFIGTLVHHALEYWYRLELRPFHSIHEYLVEQGITEFGDSLATPQNYINQLPTQMQQQVHEAIAYAEHYIAWQQHDNTWLADREFDFIEPEQSFSRVLFKNSRKQINHDGRFDGVVQHRQNKKHYLWELKTTRSITEREKQLLFDSQADTYTIAVQDILGQPIAGIVYTLIRKKIPEQPIILKNGMLSQNTSIDTTPELYLAAIKAHHGIDATKEFITTNYQSILNALVIQPNKFFRRVVVNRSQAELRRANDEFLTVAKEMINPATPIYATDGPHCNYCLFRTPCDAMRKGLDYQAILNSAFVQKQSKEAHE